MGESIKNISDLVGKRIERVNEFDGELGLKLEGVDGIVTLHLYVSSPGCETCGYGRSVEVNVHHVW